MTLRGRLLAAFAYLLLLIVIALAVPLAVNVDRRAKDSFYAAVDSQTQVIAASLGGSPQPGRSLSGVRNSWPNEAIQMTCSFSLWRQPKFNVSVSRVKLVRDVPCNSAMMVVFLETSVPPTMP